ncbi:MAG: DUF3179 domain-containing protein [Planctomycetaceae bacterium]|nr:DUF3179 domain-containing protein [Planctomycetaceae bacterium]
MAKVKYITAGAGVLLLAALLAYGCLLVTDHIALQVTEQYPDDEMLQDEFLDGQFETPERSFVTVGGANLDDQDEVITLNIGEQHYAFPKRWMNGMSEHVVSEVYEGLPIAVTYCNESECVRVFQGQPGEEKLDIMQAGLAAGHMAILVKGKSYLQEAENIPYGEYPFELMSWGEWKTNHPDGQVLDEILWE